MLYLAFRRSRHLNLSPSYWGLISLSTGLFLLWAGLRANQPRFSLLGAPFIVLGLTHYLAGAKIAKFAIFPALVLCFAIPIPEVELFFSGRLQIFISKLAYQIGLLLGLDLSQRGATIVIANGSLLELAVGSSGSRFVMVTLLSTAVLSFLTQQSALKQWFLFVISAPVLIAWMTSRLVLILWLAATGHEDFAKSFYHDWGCLFIFTFTIATLFLISHSLKRRDQARATPRRSGGE